MDDEDDLGGFPIIFGNTHLYIYINALGCEIPSKKRGSNPVRPGIPLKPEKKNCSIMGILATPPRNKGLIRPY